jgi:hypothetical protein
MASVNVPSSNAVAPFVRLIFLTRDSNSAIELSNNESRSSTASAGASPSTY